MIKRIRQWTNFLIILIRTYKKEKIDMKYLKKLYNQNKITFCHFSFLIRFFKKKNTKNDFKLIEFDRKNKDEKETKENI